MLCIELCELSVGILAPYAELYDYFRDFLTDRAPDFTVSVSEEEARLEAAEAPLGTPLWYSASVALYRKIANRLPLYDACVYHGCVVTLGERAYLFSAKSGVGKTTHAKNWLSVYPEACRILNGDKPILRLVGDEVRVYGTPWRGKEGYGTVGAARLCGIAYLFRGEENRAQGVTPHDAAPQFLSQMYLPREDSTLLERSLALADTVLTRVPSISLFVNTAPESAIIAREALERQSV